MDLDDSQKYAAAALFTLALHKTQARLNITIFLTLSYFVRQLLMVLSSIFRPLSCLQSYGLKVVPAANRGIQGYGKHFFFG
jgi:hypothetical protein